MKPRWEVYGFEPPSDLEQTVMHNFAGCATANGRWARWVLGYTAAEIHEASEECWSFRARWKNAIRLGLIASQPKWATELRRRRREAQKRVTKLLREQEGNAVWYRKQMKEGTP